MPRTNRPYTTRRSSPLAKLRVRAGLSSGEAAKELGISVPSLLNVEHGVRASDALRAAMVRVYRVSELAIKRAYFAGRRDFMAGEKL